MDEQKLEFASLSEEAKFLIWLDLMARVREFHLAFDARLDALLAKYPPNPNAQESARPKGKRCAADSAKLQRTEAPSPTTH